jgi:hypothetical protein
VERGSRGRLIAAAVAAVALALSGARAATVGVEQRGVFALLGGTPRIQSTARSQFAGASLMLAIRQYRRNGTALTRYDSDMEMLMHLVVVRDDFREFMHLHPAFDSTTGSFKQTFPVDRSHRYFVYADSTPTGIAQQVFRFMVSRAGSGGSGPPRTGFDEVPSPTTVSAGPYSVVLARTTLQANDPQTLDVTVYKGASPAPDLATYLGAAAHAVFIDTSTLQYVHIHPTPRGAKSMAMGADMNMNESAQAGPLMTMQVPALPPGTYKLWIQFRGARGAVYVAPFTLRAR